VSPAPASAAATTAAVLDVGSNSVLLLTIAVAADGRARAIDEAAATTRLGEGLVDGARLDPTAAGRTAAVVVEFAARARRAGATTLWGFATAAARRAADGATWVRDVAAAASLPIEILSGEREGRLAYAAATAAAGTGPTLGVDIGGGTTELTLGEGDVVHESLSVPLGALALTERFLRSDPPSSAELAALRDAVDATLADAPVVARARGAGVLSSGGTATSLAALDLALSRYEPRRVHGHVLAARMVRALGERLAAESSAALATHPGVLDAGRAAILPAGAIVLDGVLRAVDAITVTVSDHGVRHAYLRERLRALGVAADLGALWG
jgi:exopolyphosphatase/guanosine-5'-triphosphate,3'-diphosphate pyrophosphatase